MANWYVERVGQAVITTVSVISLSFVIVKSLPGGPAAYFRSQLAMSGQDMSAVNQLVERYISLNPSDPLHIQYIDYMSAMLVGDLGESVYFNEPVSTILADALPWTIFYASMSLIVTFVLAIVIGATMAYYEGSLFDSSGTVVMMIANSVPYYAAALLLLYVFGYQLQFFPTGGKLGTGIDFGLTLEFFTSALHHAALPVISIVVTFTGGFAIAMRGNSISILGTDYLRVANLRGLPSSIIAIRYVARNAVLPLYTQFLISFGFVFGGSIVLEIIFRYPGAGFFMLRAIETRDTPLMMGTFLAVTIAVVIGVFIADLTYGLLDPRASGGESREAY